MKKIILFLSLLVLVTGITKAANLIGVTSPEYCAEIEGNTLINITAPNFQRVNLHCWKSGGVYGTYTLIGRVNLDDNGTGSIMFPADEYPHGPLTITISGIDSNNVQVWTKFTLK